MSIMEDIYNGKIYPAEQVVPDDPEYQEASQKIRQKLDDLEDLLDDSHIVTEIMDLLAVTQDKMCLEFYRYGVSMGLMMMEEAYKNPHLQNVEMGQIE